jgi:hypothetical protein
MVEAELRHYAGPEVLDDDVDGKRELARSFEAFRTFEVERRRPLVAIDRCEILAVAVDHRRPRAHQVAVGRLDLDHVRAHVREQRAAERARKNLAELGNAHAGERKHRG